MPNRLGESPQCLNPRKEAIVNQGKMVVGKWSHSGKNTSVGCQTVIPENILTSNIMWSAG